MRFPLGDYLKSEVRQLAKQFNLPVREKPDSQDICFVTSNSYRDLINKLSSSEESKKIFTKFGSFVVNELFIQEDLFP